MVIKFIYHHLFLDKFKSHHDLSFFNNIFMSNVLAGYILEQIIFD